MTYEKHTTHTDALDTLGTIPATPQKRDAIHLAVEYVEAACNLRPGEHLKFTDDGKVTYTVSGGPGAVGIVDPFLDQIIDQGQWFWLIVYPRQINSLRHVWEHPDFPASGETDVGVPVAALSTDTALMAKHAAELWLRSFADRSDVPGFEELISATKYSVTNNYGYVSFGQDAGGDIPPEFWGYFETYTGMSVPKQDRAEYFSCAC